MQMFQQTYKILIAGSSCLAQKTIFSQVIPVTSLIDITCSVSEKFPNGSKVVLFGSLEQWGFPDPVVKKKWLMRNKVKHRVPLSRASTAFARGSLYLEHFHWKISNAHVPSEVFFEGTKKEQEKAEQCSSKNTLKFIISWLTDTEPYGGSRGKDRETTKMFLVFIAHITRRRNSEWWVTEALLWVGSYPRSQKKPVVSSHSTVN